MQQMRQSRPSFLWHQLHPHAHTVSVSDKNNEMSTSFSASFSAHHRRPVRGPLFKNNTQLNEILKNHKNYMYIILNHVRYFVNCTAGRLIERAKMFPPHDRSKQVSAKGRTKSEAILMGGEGEGLDDSNLYDRRITKDKEMEEEEE
jgi:hypothetical protein